MAGSEIIVPDFDFSGFYYAEILEALIAYKRANIPEISNENPFETGIQLLRAFALIGHLNNVLLDLVAQEVYVPSAQVRENVVRALALIGFTARANVPATTTLRAQLTRGFTTTTAVIPDNALFGTRRRANTPSILFEADEAISVEPTNQLSACWARDGAGNWADLTAYANGFGIPGISAVAGNAIYFAHDSVFTDAIEFEDLNGFDPGDDRDATPVAIHLQYYDGEIEDRAPDAVTIQPSNIRFDIDALLGTSETMVGGYAFVTVNATGVVERLPIQHDGNNYIESAGFLGQTVVSPDVADYTVGSYWHLVQIATDTTSATKERTEVLTTGNGIASSFGPITIDRYPLEPESIVVFNYNSGGLPKTATLDLSDNSLGGDAATGTSVNPNTGVVHLWTQSVPDIGDITITYQRKSARYRQSGKITFLPPFNADDNWVKGQVPEDLRGSTGPTNEGYWLRILFSSFGAGSLSGFEFDRAHWDRGGMYLRIPVTQGRTINETLGSGDGTPSQVFEPGDSPVIEGSVILTVDGEEWTQVEDFFASNEVDEHYTVNIDSDGFASILTGDGENGKIVPVGTNNVEVEYRIGAEEDGNVGPSQIEVSRTGLSGVKLITNPRAAFGWIQQEGSDELGLEKLKRDGVSSLRVLRRAVSPSDIEYLATRWLNGSQYPFSRARAIENGFGLKTIKLIVVPVGGGTSSPSLRALLDTYFNGNLNEGGTEAGVLVANQEVTSIDYTPNVIDLVATVEGGDEATIKAAIQGQLQPEALRDDTSYRWAFGQTVTRAAISAILFNADRDTVNVTITSLESNGVPVVGDIPLADDELPKLGTLDLTVT